MKISRLSEIKLIFLLAVALVIFISLLTFDPNDIRFLTSDPNPSKSNITGFVGAYLAWWLFFLMGLGSYIVPFLIALWGIRPKKIYLRVFGGIFSILAVSSLLSLIGPEGAIYRFQKGGIIGLAFSDFLLKYLGTAGTFIAITVLLLLSFLITTDFLVFSFIGWLFARLKAILKWAGSIVSGIIQKRKLAREALPRKEKVTPIPAAEVKTPEKTKIKTIKEKIIKKEKLPAQKKQVVYKTPYELPPLGLLKTPPPIAEREIKEDLEGNSRILEDTLRDFGVEAKVVKVSKGPVITRYELEPASGVKVHRITSLSDNIALSMKAVSVRIVAPIPGKGTVGVEVPNSKSTLVYLKEVLESKEYKGSDSKLMLALGKDISGIPIVADLDDMPHLLIAGTTGSGKTVCVNSVITALLSRASPDELKFLMVDPKRVELAVFNNLPHLLAPVVTEAKKAASALHWAVEEMERRLDLFTEIGVRNIAAYKEREKDENLSALPYIIIVIDELHDLMLVAQQEVEDMITRLAALSRAVGIHMIIATQRPSVDVITGVIKANLPARISFKVASKVDSRTVLDMNGAEKLLGRGDMLFIKPGTPKPVRLQGVLVTDDEIGKIVDFIKSQRKPHFEEEILKVEERAKYKKFEKDEIYEKAVELVLQSKQASVSMLQRRLGVGYTRAARLIDMMEDERIVGPYQGSKPREVLVDNTDDAK
ncbi:MAG: DNA translocase FtsK [Candidatus Omnitrophota bacterium]